MSNILDNLNLLNNIEQAGGFDNPSSYFTTVDIDSYNKKFYEKHKWLAKILEGKENYRKEDLGAIAEVNSLEENEDEIQM